MLKKGSKIYSIVKMKCPQCHEGDFFISKPYDLKNAGKLHEFCTFCDLKYEKEIVFYYGSMYVSYALQVAVFVSFWTSFNLFSPTISTGFQIGIILLASLLLTPYLYAISKITWINLFISFDQNAKNKKPIN
ncbi:MAG: DUF983 domain-containing protein [Flavobacteriia bacterium]|nr:DUF983 domain-containing protein [Flavobacteriia bacterium]